MDPINEHGRPLGAFRHKLVIVNAREINDHTPPGVRRWLELIDDSLDEEGSKREFWRAFKTLGVWYDDLPPY
jgi:hypothetical protein